MSRGFLLRAYQSSITSPPTLTSYSLTGIFLPEASIALFTAHFNPVQHGTSICMTTTEAILFFWNISVSFWAYAFASLNLGQPMMTRLSVVHSWKFLSVTGAQSATNNSVAFSKKGALGGTRSSFTGHWVFWEGRLTGVVDFIFCLLFWYSCTSCSLNASASRSMMVMAPCGQCPRQAPKPSQ